MPSIKKGFESSHSDQFHRQQAIVFKSLLYNAQVIPHNTKSLSCPSFYGATSTFRRISLTHRNSLTFLPHINLSSGKRDIFLEVIHCGDQINLAGPKSYRNKNRSVILTIPDYDAGFFLHEVTGHRIRYSIYLIISIIEYLECGCVYKKILAYLSYDTFESCLVSAFFC